MTLPLDDKDYKEIEKLVRSAVSRSKQKVYAEFEDVVQEAMLFLLRNLKYYNPEKGKMSTFVYINVKRSIVNQVIHHNALKRKRINF
jgi:DNA-directed RNA polymerase specialized sigma subunit